MGWDRNNILQYLFRCNASKERLTSIIKACYKYILDQSTTAIIKNIA